jgi:pimeloyl-ACP methyl ester carboxylesterase
MNRPLLAALVLAASARAAAPAAPPPLAPCEIPGLAGPARCATYEVFEDRARAAGRKIGLKVVVVPATSGQPTDEAITFFAGGPGDSSTRPAGPLAQMLASARADRDVVLVDFRGTGGSAPLNCPELAVDGVQGFLDEFLPAAKVAACRARLEKERSLALYTSEEAVDDVAEVLAAYGYRRVNLYGVSYGTRAAQVFARRHPAMTRTMILEGVTRLSERDPLDFARAAQRALDQLVAECAADAGCHAAFPALGDDLAAVFARLEKAPVTVEVTDAASGATRALRLDRRGFAQTIRYMLYVPSTAVVLPLQVHQAAQGDFRPIAETAQLFGSLMTSMADGFFLSVTCPEDTRFIREADVAPAVAGSFLGDFRIRAQQAACAAWAPRDPDPAFQQPLVSAIPTLLLSGERDPVTPAANGAEVARHLSRSLHLVVPSGAHGTEGMSGADCLERLAAEFVAAGRVEGLDASCVAAMRRPPFVLAPPAAAVELAEGELAALVGRYRHPASGNEVEIELADGNLRMTTHENPPIALRPVSRERFELVGLPPGYALVAQRDARGAVTGIAFEAPGEPAETLVKLPPAP